MIEISIPVWLVFVLFYWFSCGYLTCRLVYRIDGPGKNSFKNYVVMFFFWPIVAIMELDH